MEYDHIVFGLGCVTNFYGIPGLCDSLAKTKMTMELKIGDPAPDFRAPAVGGIYGGGQEVKLDDFAGSTLVLCFCPKDDTPGCTIQACDLRDSWRELQSKVELFGVSIDSVGSHQKSVKKHGLPFPLLSDPQREIGTKKAKTPFSENHRFHGIPTYKSSLTSV